MKLALRRFLTSASCLAAMAGTCIADDLTIIDAATQQTARGDTFTVTKGIRDGMEFTSYSRDGKTYTPEEFRAFELEHPQPVIDDALLAAAAKAAPDTLIPVTIWLSDNPGTNIVRAARAEIQPMLDALSQRACDIARAARPAEPMDATQERNWLLFHRAPVNALSPEILEHRAITRDYEALKAVARAKCRPLVEAAIAKSQSELAARVAQLGGTMLSRITVINGAVVAVPAAQLQALATTPGIGRIFDVPDATLELDVQKVYLGHQSFWTAGFEGGVWDPGILDTGIQQNHPTFAGIVFDEAPGVGITDTDGHGTAVTSITCGRDATFTGMARTAARVLVGRFASGNVQGDASWMVDTATDDPECINLSAGYGTANDVDYSNFDQFFDALIDNHFVGLAKSTGNNGDGTTTITHPASAYNTLSVANMEDMNTSSQTDDRIRSTSSRGPTLNGRNKPDISAPGHNTTAANNDWAGAGADWIQFTGTSSAAPHVTGGMILLTDQRSSDDSKSNKAILLNTADTWSDAGTSGDTSDDGQITGSQWNKTYGWGYLDLAEATFNAPDLFTSTVDNDATGGTPLFRLYKGHMFGGEKATLVWNRHVGWNGAVLPTVVQSFTDVDLFCYRQTTGATIDSSTSVSQNVEQVAVTATEDVVLRVYCFGTVDVDVGTESFALSTEENFTVATGPVLTSSTISPFDISPGQTRLWQVQVSNTGDLPAHNVTVDLPTIPAGWTVTAGAVPQNIGSIPVGGNAVATWTIRAPCSTITGQFSRAITSTSYGVAFAAPDINTVFTPSLTPLALDTPLAATSIPRTYSFALSSIDWSCVSIGMQLPSSGGANHDISADSDQCMTSPYQTSTEINTVTDFVVANGRTYGNVTHYARAQFGTDGAYTVEHDQAFDLGVNSTSTDSFTANEPAELYELALVAGRTYRATFTQSVGAMDPALFVFRPDRDNGDRANANWRRDSTGAGGSEFLVFQAPVTGTYAFVIANDNHNACNFTFRVTCAADFNQDGVLSVQDIFDFLTAWFAQTPAADFLQNGTLNVQDIFDFLTVWFSGC